MTYCGARTRAGGFCNKHAITNKSRCRLHGGLSLTGKDHPQYKHGRRSKSYIENARKAREQLSYLKMLCNQFRLFLGVD